MSSYYYTHSSRNVGGVFVPTRRGDPEALPHASPPSLINSGGMAGGRGNLSFGRQPSPVAFSIEESNLCSSRTGLGMG